MREVNKGERKGRERKRIERDLIFSGCSYVEEKMPFIGLHKSFSLLILKMSK